MQQFFGNTRSRTLALALGGLMALVASLSMLDSRAQNATSPATGKAARANVDLAEIQKKLETRLGRKIDAVTKLDYADLYEVRVDTDIVYTDASADHLIVGSIIDTKTRANMTKARVDALVEAATPKVKLADLPLASAIKVVRGSGKRQVAIFEDPNCGYCKKLEKSILETSDVTLYVFLYPVLGPDSIEKSRSIWCAADRAKTWTNWMQSAIAIPAAVNANCGNPLDKNLELGKKLRVEGTPTLIFPNGKRIPGAVDTEDLKQLLVENG